MDLKDQVIALLEQSAGQTLESAVGSDVVVFLFGDTVAIKAEAQPCQFKPLESQKVPLNADLCDMPGDAERVAARVIDLRLKEPAFESGLRAADWNNIGCLSVWRPEPDRKGAAARFEKAMKDELGYGNLPPAAQRIVKDNLDLLRAVPDDSSTGVIIRPRVALERDLGRAEIERMAAGLVEGLRCEIVE